MGSMIEESCFDFRQGYKMFSSPKYPDRLWSPPGLLYNGTGGSFCELKAAEK
jgi:hypothetical protein